MNVMIVGGHRSIQGGIEQFCKRAVRALSSIGRHHVEHVFSDAAYLRLHSTAGFIDCIRTVLRNRNRPWDCLWVQYGSFPDLLLLALGRLLGYRVLITPHIGANWSSLRNPVLSLCARSMLGLAHGIALLSESQAEELTLPPSVPRFRILTFLPQALSGSDKPPPRANGPLRLVHAARLSKLKGSFLFIATCARLKRAGLDFHARLIGTCDEETKSALLGQIQEDDLANEIDFVGSLSEADLLLELAQADVLIHLSQIDSFPLILLESISCGVFPICWNLPGPRQITKTYCGALVQGAGAAQDAGDFLLHHDIDRLRQWAEAAGRQSRLDYDWSLCVAACELAFSAVAETQ